MLKTADQMGLGLWTRHIDLTANPEEQAKLALAQELHLPVWLGRARVDKFYTPFTPEGIFVPDHERPEGVEPGHPLWTPDQVRRGEAEPYEIVDSGYNLLLYGGASCLWQCLIGNGTGTAAQTLTYFNNGNAAIGVGDSTTAEAATQTNLQAASNKTRIAMDSTYPQHTDATTSGAASIIFRSTFATTDANYAWQEWGVFNDVTANAHRMLQRKVQSLGTKTSAGTWVLTVTLTLS